MVGGDPMTQTRWKCPTCGHGLLAPTRPRLNDVRRYCLPCSSKAGVLVERVAPALEAQRAKRDVARREREKAQRDRERKRKNPPRKVAARTFSKVGEFGMPIQTETARLWRMLRHMPPTYRGATTAISRSKRMTPPKVAVKQKSWQLDKDGRVFTRGAMGLAYMGEHRIAVEPKVSWETLAHEIIHCAGYRNHDYAFYSALIWLTERRWRTTIKDRHTITRYGYHIDWMIERQITDIVRSHFQPTSIEPPQTTTE